MIPRIDLSNTQLDIRRDFAITARARQPGPPRRVDGMTLGLVTMTADAPHGGEVHPDGDEALLVISGRLRVIGDSFPDAPVELGPGEGCVIPRGEWHVVQVIEPATFLHATPGPNGDHRAKGAAR
ncbi:MAG: cupin domain-containing protein [Alphaproteobacteria bacterium]|nr:cupin domain-containing protein [Alphaproteobacteria bacterium]